MDTLFQNDFSIFIGTENEYRNYFIFKLNIPDDELPDLEIGRYPIDDTPVTIRFLKREWEETWFIEDGIVEDEPLLRPGTMPYVLVTAPARRWAEKAGGRGFFYTQTD